MSERRKSDEEVAGALEQRGCFADAVEFDLIVSRSAIPPHTQKSQMLTQEIEGEERDSYILQLLGVHSICVKSRNISRHYT